MESMSKLSAHIVLLIIFTVSVNLSFAQGNFVRASINREKILIGEPIQLTLEATVSAEAMPKWFPLDSLAHFEIIEAGKIDSSVIDENKSYKQVLSVTSFDSGRWVIPSLPLEMNGRFYLTDSLPVSVAFSNFDPNQDYHDIKDILEIDNPYVRYINWGLALITLLSLIGVIYFLKKSRIAGRRVTQKNTPGDPFAEAMQSLELLRQQQLPEKGEVKRYYTVLNDIIRMFMLRKMGFATMEKTNEELLLQVKQTALSHEEVIRLAQVLRMSDAVKFAKYIPGSADNDQSFQTTETTVQLLNKLKGSAV